MGKVLNLVILLNLLPMIGLFAQEMTRHEYIDTYKYIAIKEMERSGIPASITLAQGLLESNNGNSRLAIKGNNHFGIKCHDWKGKKMYHDDDEQDECFRKYKSANESYMDHTDFLMNSPRYQFLFYLDQTDYRGWAKGLKKSGYATSPQYANLLIDIIEENELYVYDKPQSLKKRKNNQELADIDKQGFQITEPHRRILVRNRINYILAKEGDTYQTITEEMEMMPFELARYNEFPRDSKIAPGQLIYLQPKRRRASAEFKYHTVEEGENMYHISQMYGIKLKHLYRMNMMNEGDEPEEGVILNLRKAQKPEQVEVE
jgi:hypothetical protein